RLATNRQVHSTVVNEAVGGVRGTVGDGLWSAEPGLPMLALSADCVPVALAAPGRRRLGVLHPRLRVPAPRPVSARSRAGAAGRAASWRRALPHSAATRPTPSWRR